MAFLDYNGLIRFKSKLDAAFAAIGHRHDNATNAVDGFMSANDKGVVENFSIVNGKVCIKYQKEVDE